MNLPTWVLNLPPSSARETTLEPLGVFGELEVQLPEALQHMVDRVLGTPDSQSNGIQLTIVKPILSGCKGRRAEHKGP